MHTHTFMYTHTNHKPDDIYNIITTVFCSFLFALLYYYFAFISKGLIQTIRKKPIGIIHEC